MTTITPTTHDFSREGLIGGALGAAFFTAWIVVASGCSDGLPHRADLATGDLATGDLATGDVSRRDIDVKDAAAKDRNLADIGGGDIPPRDLPGQPDGSGGGDAGPPPPTDPKPTYYVDSVLGDDTKDGRTLGTAWKTLGKVNASRNKLRPGDVISLRRGQIFEGRFVFDGLKGIKGSPIVFAAYGAGPRPQITGLRSEKQPIWTSEGGNRWSTPRSYPTTRLWMNGVEQKRTCRPDKQNNGVIKYQQPVSEKNNVKREFGGPGGAVWVWSSATSYPVTGWSLGSGAIYYYSKTKPTGSIAYQGTSTEFYLRNASYIRIENLDLRGSGGSVIDIDDSDHIVIRYCTLGKRAGGGVSLSNSSDVVITRNTLDADFKLSYSGFLSYTGTDYRGVSDGVGLWGKTTSVEIMYNDFFNWGHAAVGMSAGSSDMHDNSFHHNYITVAGNSYGRVVGVSGKAHDNDIHHNISEQMRTQSQIGGRKNRVHHNVVKKMWDEEFKYGQLGNAFSLSANGGHPSDSNIIEYNTITDVEGSGIIFTVGTVDVINNIIRNNLLIDTGSSVQGVKHKSIYVQPYEHIRQNTIVDNAIIHKGTKTTISFRGKWSLTVAEFNAYNGNTLYRLYDTTGVDVLPKGDVIHGNLDHDPKNGTVGAGVLTRSQVGVQGL